MTTIVLTLSREELQLFEALMKLRRHPPGFAQHKDCSYYYMTSAVEELQIIQLYVYSKKREVIAELLAHGIPFRKAAASVEARLSMIARAAFDAGSDNVSP